MNHEKKKRPDGRFFAVPGKIDSYLACAAM